MPPAQRGKLPRLQTPELVIGKPDIDASKRPELQPVLLPAYWPGFVGSAVFSGSGSGMLAAQAFTTSCRTL